MTIRGVHVSDISGYLLEVEGGVLEEIVFEQLPSNEFCCFSTIKLCM